MAAVSIIAAFSLFPLSTWLLRPLEARFTAPGQAHLNVHGIIVLGGAINLGESMGGGLPVLNDHAPRMTAFLMLARRYPAAKLVFSGGDPKLESGGPTEAQVARLLFRQMGLDVRRITFEDQSRNTHENAEFSHRIVRPEAGQSWLLVTSAADMPRAVGCFRETGWPVIPFPTDYHAQGSDWFPGMVTGMKNLDWAAHEWIGLAYYYMRGWTSSLFPGPTGADN